MNMAISKHEIIKSISLGERVAEDERDSLENYFVQTDQWDQLYAGNRDIVFGPKGTGKSALYGLLNKKPADLRKNNIILATAENIRGATVFKGIIASPPPSEISFIFLWKLYCLALIGKTLRENKINNSNATSLIDALTTAQLLPNNASIGTLFRLAQDYLKNLISSEKSAIEHSLCIDPISGMPTVSRRVELRDTKIEDRISSIPVDEFLAIADRALEEEDKKIWVLFDRLDVAFIESRDLEKNALRALFRAYNDLRALNNIYLKIFVRDDVWNRISSGGFSEASHIIKTTQIKWDERSLLDLIAKRLSRSDSLIAYIQDIFNERNPPKNNTTGFKELLSTDFEMKKFMVETILPDKVDTGKNPNTFEWMVSRVRDGLATSAPRELIHMFETIRANQLKRLERGEAEPEGTMLFDRGVFKEALDEVSKTRYKQTFLAEYPEYSTYTDRLKSEKAEQTVLTLAKIWETTVSDAESIADQLVDVGFFEQRGSSGAYTYWVPFLYRGALDLIQGKAD